MTNANKAEHDFGSTHDRPGVMIRSCAAVFVPAVLLPLLTPLSAAAIPNPYPQPMPGQSLLFPSAGVVCDQPAQRCYDSDGLSLAMTQQYFGSFAQQNALQSLGGRRPGPVFRLSNGSRCDVRQLSCWSDSDGQALIDSA